MQQEISPESSRGGIDIKRVYGEWTTSYLLIRNANVGDGGLYVCAPAGGSQTNIKVHVFQNGTHKLLVLLLLVLSYCHPRGYLYIVWQCPHTSLFLWYLFPNFFVRFPRIVSFLGERPEAMQTGTSTYFADKGYIMHTLLVATIISIYNIFRDYYSSIIIDRISIEDVTWQTSAHISRQRRFQWIWDLNSYMWRSNGWRHS